MRVSEYTLDIAHALSLPISKLLRYVQMFQVVVYGPLVLLQKSVRVSKAITGLSLHHLVPQLPGQLQGFPKAKRQIRIKVGE